VVARRIGLVLTLAVGFLALLPASALAQGCNKDVDCKGERICVEAVCVDPPPDLHRLNITRSSVTPRIREIGPSVD